MGLVFNRNIDSLYDIWCQSPEGRTLERCMERLILGLVDPQPGERILDIGCGSGTHLIMLNKLGLNICGLDASPYMVEKARKRLGKQCDLRKGRAEDLPFDDNEFDLAFLINTLEFLDDPLQALREAGRVTKRKIFVGVINSLSWTGLSRKIQGCFGNTLFRHTKFYSVWQLKSLLKSAYGPAPTT